MQPPRARACRKGARSTKRPVHEKENSVERAWRMWVGGVVVQVPVQEAVCVGTTRTPRIELQRRAAVTAAASPRSRLLPLSSTPPQPIHALAHPPAQRTHTQSKQQPLHADDLPSIGTFSPDISSIGPPVAGREDEHTPWAPSTPPPHTPSQERAVGKALSASAAAPPRPQAQAAAEG